jgi:transposase
MSLQWRIPGNISDVSTLRNLVLTFKALEVKRLHYLMDKGFYSRNNVDALVEKCFDDLKNSLEMKRLRMHTSATVDGRLFEQFIALILISAIRKEMRSSELIEKYTVSELLQEMKTLTKVNILGSTLISSQR